MQNVNAILVIIENFEKSVTNCSGEIYAAMQ